MRDPADIDKFIANWRDTGGSELANNTQSFIKGLCHLLSVDVFAGCRTRQHYRTDPNDRSRVIADID